MCKKLMCLMLVFGLTSAAGGTPQLSGPSTIMRNQTITLTVSGSSDEATHSDTNLDPLGRASYAGLIIVDLDTDGYYGPRTTHDGVILSNPSVFTSNVGGSTSIAPYIYTYDTSNRIDFTAGTSETWSEATDVDEGVWFTFDVTLDNSWQGGFWGYYNIPIDLFQNAGPVLETHILTFVVPEPASAVLIGLGAIFFGLRRKRN